MQKPEYRILMWAISWASAIICISGSSEIDSVIMYEFPIFVMLARAQGGRSSEIRICTCGMRGSNLARLSIRGRVARKFLMFSCSVESNFRHLHRFSWCILDYITLYVKVFALGITFIHSPFLTSMIYWKKKDECRIVGFFIPLYHYFALCREDRKAYLHIYGAQSCNLHDSVMPILQNGKSIFPGAGY